MLKNEQEIFKLCFDLMYNRKFEEVDGLILNCIDNKESLQTYVNLLTICHVHKDSLKNHKPLLIVARKQGILEGFTETQIDRTLDGF